MATLELLLEAADVLGYSHILWDDENHCFSGHMGYGGPPVFVAWDEEELIQVVRREQSCNSRN